MFRRRIYAQGFTIAALVAGSAYWSGDRAKRKEFEETEKERKRIERKERWLAELEARDREDRDFKEKVGRRLGRRRGQILEEKEQVFDAAVREGGDIASPTGLVVEAGVGNGDKKQDGGGVLSAVSGLWASKKD